MKYSMLVVLVVGLFCCGVAEAKPRRYYSNTNSNYYSNKASTYTSSVGANDTSSAQGVAEIMARTGRVGHWGGNRGYEGCGSGSSQESAYRNCCYSNSGMTTVDVGYAQGRNGQWYCCRRYR
jgi:hypothetical protein